MRHSREGRGDPALYDEDEQYERSGSPVRGSQSTQCEVADCDRAAARNGRCWGHVKQARRQTTMKRLREYSQEPWDLVERTALAYADANESDDAEWARVRDRFQKAVYRYAEHLMAKRRRTMSTSARNVG